MYLLNRDTSMISTAEKSPFTTFPPGPRAAYDFRGASFSRSATFLHVCTQASRNLVVRGTAIPSALLEQGRHFFPVISLA